MNVKIYRPVILKTLQDANVNKPASLDALVDRVISNMEVFGEMFSLAGGEAALVQKQEQPSKPGELFENKQVQQFDMSQRIVPKQDRQYSEEEIQELKNTAIVKYKETIPTSVQVQPPGFDKPIEIQFRGPMNSRGAMPFVGLQWCAVGAGQGFTIQQDVTATLMSREQVIENVKEQATALYLSAPKTIAKRYPSPIDTNLSTGAWASDETPMIDGH